MERKPAVGLLGIVGIWITAGLALPFVNVLRELSAPQLMAARGLVTAALAYALLRGVVWEPDRATLGMAASFALACLGLYMGIRAWGASPTIVIVTATPLVNFAVATWRGRTVSGAAIASLLLTLAGVLIALRPWDAQLLRSGEHLRAGLAWSVFGALLNGAFYEFLARARSTPRLERCFWQAVAVLVVGVVGSASASWQPALQDGRLLAWLVGFAFVGGFLYFLANIEAFDHLPTDVASVLAQGETPAVILMASLLLGERLSASQWVGVLLALSGAWYLSHWLTAAPQPQSATT